KLSLTSIVEPLVAARQLYFESLYVVKLLDKDLLTAADIGSGSGFPGLPISLIRPDISVTLIEADQRKAAFLGEARRQLGLTNLKIINSRFESIQTSFEIVLARAIERFEVQMPRLLDFCSNSRQVIFFLTRSAISRVLAAPANRAGLSGWLRRSAPLPESRE